MAGLLLLKELSAITLEGNGAALNTLTAADANDTTLDNRNGGNGAQSSWANFELVTGFGSAPLVGAVISLYLVPALDGTNYAEVDTSTPLFQLTTHAGNFTVLKAATAAQRLVLLHVRLQALLYKAYVWNLTAQQMSATWTLKVVPVQGQYT